MQLYKKKLSWADGLNTLIFHGQRAEVAEPFNVTSIFQVAALYGDTRFVEEKLIVGFIVGTFSKYLAGYAEGHYLLTEKGERKQHFELSRRGLASEDVWIHDPH